MKLILINLLHGFVAVFLLVVAYQDIKNREVHNWNSIAIALCALFRMAVLGQWDFYGFLPSLFIVIIYLFTEGKFIGGADIKVLAAIGLYMSLVPTLLILFVACFSASALSPIQAQSGIDLLRL